MLDKMSTFRELVLIAFVFIQVITSVDNRKAPSACQPYAEGSVVSFQCTDSNRSRDLYWHHNDASAATCLHNSTTCKGNYQAVRENGTSSISIIGVNRNDPTNEGRWRCGYDSPDEDLYHCDLIIYHAPENLHCKPPVLTQEEKQLVVVVNCSAFNVFPAAKCTFFRRISLNNDVELQTSSYRQENTKDIPIYYNIFCGLTYPITKDLVGNLTFFLQISMDLNKTYDSNQTSIHIDAPKPNLLDNCFSVREDNVFWPNEDINCTCELRDIDNSTIDVSWKYADYPDIMHYQKTLHIHYQEDKVATFICEGTSRSGSVYNITYKPNVAVPAKVIQFTANEETDLNVENATVVEFNCEVDSKPRGTVYITDSLGQRLDGASKLLTCDETGTYTCLAFNEIFPNDISRQYVHVTVKCNPWLELITTGSKIQRVYADTAENVSIDYELSMGKTKITKYEIYKDGIDTPTVMYADKDENAANGRYRIQFQSLSETHYKITLNIFTIESSDFGTYTLKIYDDNGDVVEGNLEIKGTISDDITTKPVFYVQLTIIIALSILCIGILVFFIYQKRKKATGGTGTISAGLSAQNNNTTNNTTNSTRNNTSMNTTNTTGITLNRDDAHLTGNSFSTTNESSSLLDNSLTHLSGYSMGNDNSSFLNDRFDTSSVYQGRQYRDETQLKSISVTARESPIGTEVLEEIDSNNLQSSKLSVLGIRESTSGQTTRKSRKSRRDNKRSHKSRSPRPSIP